MGAPTKRKIIFSKNVLLKPSFENKCSIVIAMSLRSFDTSPTNKPYYTFELKRWYFFFSNVPANTDRTIVAKVCWGLDLHPKVRYSWNTGGLGGKKRRYCYPIPNSILTV
uniref:Uncharacterized protein n=1 Tax=Leptocylindrus danicus TaxID=163516 RepID=A0A7S2KRY6_9STRA|mmetsp:Transcript_25973/g.38761  ORF Transcript_25973/g.38761 Transcript_25973/m.38761 type:complete len:110 (+) Transcript_25973:157-486(+)